MIETTTTVLGTAQEIIEYLQASGNGAKYLLTVEPSSTAQEASLPPLLSIEEEETLLDELGALGKGRLDPTLKYDRQDIYFDR
jgi:hypothetical protein